MAPSSPSAAPAPTPAKAVVITEPRSAPPAPDDDREEEAGATASSRPRWYGWQTLAADAVTLSVFIAAGAAGGTGGSDKVAVPLAWTGALGYELAPGIVHFAHRNPGRGFASFGVRIGLPLAGALLGASIASNCDGFLCEAGGAAVGALVGAGGAIAIDAAVFAYDDPKASNSQPSTARRLSLLPVLSVTPQRAFVGLAASL